MFSLLIVICLIELWLVFLRAKDFTELRLCFVKAAVLIFAIIAFNTETLSLFNALNERNVICFWLAESLCFFGLLLFQWRNDQIIVRQSFPNLLLALKEKLTPYKAYLIVLSALFATIFLIAAASAPNTADSQTYHMARVANWIQWENVNFYPTATLRQLYLGPLAEYGILNIILLSGNDYFVNLLQFGCLFGCGITISLITREFNQNGAAQITAMLLTATIPMAILQASSTQNDLVVSFFALNFFLFYLRASETGRRSDLLFGGLTLGLAFLAKGTAYIYCAPMAIVIFASVFFSRLPQKKKLFFFAQSLLILIIAVSINSIQYTRNCQLFGSPVTTGNDFEIVNQNLMPKMVAASVVRNYVIHLATVFEESNKWIADKTTKLLGDEANNPNSNFLNIPFRIRYSGDEDEAGNFFLILLLTVCLLLGLTYKSNERKKVLIATLTIIFGFLLFSSLIKWHPWLSRFHTPFFMLGNAVIVTVLNKYGEKINILILSLCLLSSINVLLLGEPRSFFTVMDSFSNETPREEQYIVNNPEMMEAYFKAVTFVRKNNPAEVGLMIETDYRNYTFGDWEYPIWILLKKDFSDKPTIRHVGLKNASKTLETNAQMPEWIISANKENVVGGVQYDEVWNKPPLRVLRKRAN